jgi:hypothetical protein
MFEIAFEWLKNAFNTKKVCLKKKALVWIKKKKKKLKVLLKIQKA